MPSFKRRKFLINAFQYKLVGFSTLYLLAMVVLLYSASVASLLGQLHDDRLSVRERAESAQLLLHLHAQVLPFLLPIVAVIALHTVFVSHRIAGPVYRFCCTMRDVARGDLSQIVRLRKRDYLKEEAEVLNEMTEALSSRILAAQERCRGIRSESGRLEKILAESSEPVREQLWLLRAQTDELEKILDSFQPRDAYTVVDLGAAPSGSDSGSLDEGEGGSPRAA